MAYADANNLVVADLRARHVIALHQYYEIDAHAHIYCGITPKNIWGMFTAANYEYMLTIIDFLLT